MQNKAKNIYFKFNGNKKLMEINGELNEYKQFGIDENIEADWDKELAQEKLKIIKSAFDDLDNFQEKFVMNELYAILERNYIPGLISEVLDILEQNFDKLDDMSKLVACDRIRNFGKLTDREEEYNRAFKLADKKFRKLAKSSNEEISSRALISFIRKTKNGIRFKDKEVQLDNPNFEIYLIEDGIVLLRDTKKLAMDNVAFYDFEGNYLASINQMLGRSVAIKTIRCANNGLVDSLIDTQDKEYTVSIKNKTITEYAPNNGIKNNTRNSAIGKAIKKIIKK